MAAICAFETFGVGETLGGRVCRAGPTGAVVTKNSPRRAFWEELGEARQIAGALIFFEVTDCGCSWPSIRLKILHAASCVSEEKVGNAFLAASPARDG